MLTLLLLLSLSAPCPRIEHPSLPAPRAYEVPEPLPVRSCEPTQNVAALMYDLGIDAAVPVEAEEVEADIYQEEP